MSDATGNLGANGKSRKYRTSVAAGSWIGVAATVALFLALTIDKVCLNATKLGVDGSWWIYAMIIAASVVTGYSIINVWQQSVYAKLTALKLGSSKIP